MKNKTLFLISAIVLSFSMQGCWAADNGGLAQDSGVSIEPDSVGSEMAFEKIDLNSDSGKKIKEFLESQGFKDKWVSYYKINENLLIFKYGGVPIQAGVYIADIKNEQIKRVIGGLVRVLRFEKVENEKLVLVSSSVGIKNGKMRTTYDLTVCDYNLSCERDNIVSALEDGESGGCGRGAKIGISKATMVNSVSIEDNQITLEALEEDCATGRQVKININREIK